MATGGTINLTTSRIGGVNQTAGSLEATNVNLISPDGTFGSTTKLIQTNAQFLTFNTAGSAYINDTGSVTVNASANGAAVVLQAAGNITINQAVTASATTVTTTSGSNGNIIVDANLGLTTGITTLTANRIGHHNR